jgi:hypothetical protein
LQSLAGELRLLCAHSTCDCNNPLVSFATIDQDIDRVNTQRRQAPTANGTTLAAMRHQRSHFDRDCPPHAWGCPVVMKVDPRLVAWTCASCAAITTVPAGAPPPAGSAAA